jgi:UDP-N-acetylglucosamine 2-epimerase (non-hydrolysing)
LEYNGSEVWLARHWEKPLKYASITEEIELLNLKFADLIVVVSNVLKKELIGRGIPNEKIHFVGNVMIDTLLENKIKAESSNILDALGVTDRDYAVLTLHRPSNVDNPQVFERLFLAIETIQNDMPVIFPVHPRTQKHISEFSAHLKNLQNLITINPLGYLDFLKLLSFARLVLTDSGGIQEETTILKVPCLTLRQNTERPVTVECGSNIIAGTVPEKIISSYKKIMQIDRNSIRVPPLWDGLASQRIIDIILKNIHASSQNPSEFAVSK